jgi:hypothetical protein
VTEAPVGDLVLRNAKVVTFTASRPGAETAGAFNVPSALAGGPTGGLLRGATEIEEAERVS